jgi:plastocyanin
MRHRRSTCHRTTAGLALVAALTLAACAEDDPEMEPPPGQDVEGEQATDGGTEAGGSGEDPAAGATVEAVTIAFEPPVITVPVGTTVTWTNQDVVRHTVTSGTPAAADGGFDEPLAAEGGTVTITFDEPGTVAYFCDVHHNMTGEVVVE